MSELTKGFKGYISRGGGDGAGDGLYDTAETFAPAAVTIDRKMGAPDYWKFPLDDVSAGNFWTRLIINSWVPVNPPKEGVPHQGHKLGPYLLANIWLPMPLTLNTAYNQNYTETDNMMINRGSGMDFSSMKGIGATFWEQGKAAVAGAGNEGAEFVSSIASINNSGKMNLGSVSNQHMGLVYDGATLRSHALSWRMTPKNREEQDAIQKVCFALKKFSSPIVKGPLGGEVTSSKEAHMASVKAIGAAKTEEAEKIKSQIGDSMRNIGRLGIPATVSAEFWYGDKVNPHLFRIKDSFITSVEVNYTPTGTWNAYEDGAPIETQLTLNLKENAIVTQDDMKDTGGY